MILVVIGIWWFVTETSLVAPLYLPHPLNVIKSYRLELLLGAVATVVRSLVGFLLGILLAYVIHMFAITTRTISELDTQFAASRAIPVVALMPLFILWFGFGEESRILIVVLTGTVFFIAPLHGAFKDLPREWTIKQEQFELNSFHYFANIIFPGTLTVLGGAFRLTMAVCFTIAIASDYMGAQIGIGKFIDTARVTFNVPGIFLALIVSAVLGLSLDALVKLFFEKTVHWRGRTIKA